MENFAISEKPSGGSHIFLKAIPRQSSDDAYLAGLIDGEGSISITRHVDKTSVPHYYLRVSISMGQREAVRKIHELYGGYYEVCPPTGKLNNHFLRYRVVFSTDAACELLKAAFPYLCVKKAQAALAFKFREVMKQTHKKVKDTGRWARRDALVRKMLLLNKPWLEAVETARETPDRVMIQSDLGSNVETMHGDIHSVLVN
ncbi:MAG: hypothetical protein KGI66_01005 [Patescibacteria group bacterium]|nr:hypothetical protein [Patescibacteria group bacterium]